MQTTYEQIIDTIEEITNYAVDYETGHDDAGNNYAFMVPDGCAYNNAAKRLANFLEAHGITSEHSTDEILECIISLDMFEMRRGSVYGCYSSVFYDIDYRDPPPDAFELCCFEVGEVETQIDLSQLPKTPFIKGLIEKAEKDNRVCIRYDGGDCLWSYEATDSSWHAVITLDNIMDLIKDNEH